MNARKSKVTLHVAISPKSTRWIERLARDTKQIQASAARLTEHIVHAINDGIHLRQIHGKRGAAKKACQIMFLTQPSDRLRELSIALRAVNLDLLAIQRNLVHGQSSSVKRSVGRSTDKPNRRATDRQIKAKR
jgi:hypothetical protein